MIKLKSLLLETIERVGFNPSEESPDMPVDWNNPDIQINGVWNIDSIRKYAGLPPTYTAIYRSIVEVAFLDPKLAEEDPEDGEDGGGYDWDEFRFRRRGFPPVLIRRTNGKLHIMDGNHRIHWAQQVGYNTIGAWVIDDDIQKLLGRKNK
jgi:hypothetical protein